MAAETATPNSRSELFRDWPHYAGWWAVWVVGLGFLSAVGGGLVRIGEPVGMGLAVLVLTLYALVAATLFALLQNTVNRRRRKPVSWVFALLIWLALHISSVLFFSH